MNPILGCLVMILGKNSSIKESSPLQKVGLEIKTNNSDNCSPILGHQTLNCRYLTMNTKDYGD